MRCLDVVVGSLLQLALLHDACGLSCVNMDATDIVVGGWSLTVSDLGLGLVRPPSSLPLQLAHPTRPGTATGHG